MDCPQGSQGASLLGQAEFRSVYFLPDEEKNKQNKTKTQTNDPSEGKAKNVRHAYVHKPYLYSKYYSDSDDELTVEQRRQSIVSQI